MKVIVVTNHELGLYCVVGVYLNRDLAELECIGDCYIFTEITVDECELSSDDFVEVPRFNSSEHCQILDGGFQETSHGDYSIRVKYTKELFVKYFDILFKFKSKNEEFSHLKFGILWDEEFDYCYPACLNESNFEIVGKVCNEVDEYLSIHNLYFY